MPNNFEMQEDTYAIFHLQADKGAWYWAVHFSRRGKMYYRRFYETKYGDSSAAHEAAIAWRNAMLAEIPALTMVEFSQKKRSHNTSGVPGVHFLKSEAQPHGIWQAKLKLGGKSKSKSFSVLKYGLEGAYKQAVAAREKLLADAEDRPYLYAKLAKRMSPRLAR